MTLFELMLYLPLAVYAAIMGYSWVLVYTFFVYLSFILFPIIFRNKTYSYHVSTKLAAVETAVLSIVMSIMFGWDAGYYLFLFEILSLTFMNDFLVSIGKGSSSTKVPFYVSFVIAILFVGIKLTCKYIPAVYKVPDFQLTLLFYINALIVILSTPIFAINYSKQISTTIKTLRNNALLDELTGLYNRRAIRPYLDLFLNNYKESERKFGISILDIDDFKQINDTYGHNQGDKVLIEVANILKASVNESTYVARWGGEEFLVITQYNFSDSKVFYQSIEKITNQISKVEFQPEKGKKFSITVTAGCSNINKGMTIKDVINRADMRLYKGKNSGKNCIVTK